MLPGRDDTWVQSERAEVGTWVVKVYAQQQKQNCDTWEVIGMARVEDTCRRVPGDEAREKGKDQDKFEGSRAQSEGFWTDCRN